MDRPERLDNDGDLTNPANSHMKLGCINEYAEPGCSDANGAPHPEPSVDARKSMGKYEHRLIVVSP